MNVNEYSSEYIKRSQAVTGCFAMFVLFFGLTFVPLFIENSRELMASGYLFPFFSGWNFWLSPPSTVCISAGGKVSAGDSFVPA